MVQEISQILVAVIGVIIVILVGVKVMYDYSKEVTNYCDNLYGKGNWIFNETTGTKECPGIGQCFICITNKTDIAELIWGE